MTLNEGALDRAIRIVGGLTLEYAALMTWPGSATFLSWSGFVSSVFLVSGLEFLVSGVIGWSPMYALCDFSTNRKEA